MWVFYLSAVCVCVHAQLSEILKFGVHKLLSSDESSVQRVDVLQVLGQSRDGKWLVDEEHVRPAEEEADEDEERQSRTQ